MLVDKRNRFLALFVISGGVLLILAGLAFTWVNRAPLTAATPTPASVQQVERVSLAEAKAAFDAGKAVFLDVRAHGAYAATHIPGAVSIPLNDLTERMDELDPDSWIITYCT